VAAIAVLEEEGVGLLGEFLRLGGVERARGTRMPRTAAAVHAEGRGMVHSPCRKGGSPDGY
jgi:hypothetical protein